MTSSLTVLRPFMSRRFAMVLIISFMILGMAAAFLWAKQKGLLSAAAPTTPYTELYFADTNKLPKTMAARDQRQFSFVVTNAEDKPMTYPYEVRLVTDSLDQVIASGSLQLNHKEASKRTIAFTAPQSTGQFTVIVKLKQSQQRIQFRVQGQ